MVRDLFRYLFSADWRPDIPTVQINAVARGATGGRGKSRGQTEAEAYLVYRGRLAVVMNRVVAGILIASFLAILWVTLVHADRDVPPFLQNSFSMSFGFFLNALSSYM